MIVWPCYWIQPRDERRDFAPNLPNLVLLSCEESTVECACVRGGYKSPVAALLFLASRSVASSILFFLYPSMSIRR